MVRRREAVIIVLQRMCTGLRPFRYIFTGFLGLLLCVNACRETVPTCMTVSFVYPRRSIVRDDMPAHLASRRTRAMQAVIRTDKIFFLTPSGVLPSNALPITLPQCTSVRYRGIEAYEYGIGLCSSS